MIGLVVLVTIAGLQHLDAIQNHSETIVENHMAKIELATTMYTSARQRIVTMQKMTLIDDPFDRDEQALFLDKLAAQFAVARLDLLELPLTDTERVLLDEQGGLTGKALPIQREIIDLLVRDQISAAQTLLLEVAIPAQDRVLDKLKEIYDFQQEAAKIAVADGRKVYASARALLVLLSAGAIIIGLLIAWFVIRTTVKSAADRERHLSEIEQMNRVLQKQSVELSEANKQAQQANHTKSAFLANMSHEIRTPLTAIIGFAEVLNRKETEAGDRAYASNSIIRNGNHLLSIINDILDLSKVEAGKLEIETLSVPLMGVINEVESATKVLAKQKNLDFKIVCDFPLPEKIDTDPTRLTQILLNLTNNAIKFTDHGSVSLEVAVTPDGQQIRFTVTDTGIGMTAKQLNKIFDAFSQADLSTTRRFGGTGLGLSICKLLANRLQGTIDAESVYGKGSRFELALKLVTPPGTKMLSTLPGNHITVAEADQPPQVLSGRVLFAEDNSDNQRLISLYLHNLGVDIVLADNGERAVELALAEDFDLILMDMQMPVMDGLEATRILRELGNQTPIVALTANVMQQDIAACLDSGCNCLLAKPIDLPRFRQTLTSYLGKPVDVSPETDLASELIDQPEFRQLVADFLADLPRHLAAIDAAVVASDWQTLSARLHDLKGMGGGFGFPAITESAAAAHAALRQGNQVGAVALLDNLRTVICSLSQPGARQAAVFGPVS
jgi:signal transduction histidine kinase/response regulator of citrate/malate metabolism